MKKSEFAHCANPSCGERRRIETMLQHEATGWRACCAACAAEVNRLLALEDAACKA